MAIEEPVARWELQLRDRDARIAALEKQVVGLQPRKMTAKEWAGLLVPLFQAVILAAFAYAATDSVSNALRHKELQLSNLTEMRGLLVDLALADSLERARADALTLAAFGQHAVLPLVVLVQASGESQAIAAEEGLRAIGMNEPAAVCTVMKKILANRSRLYNWNAHLAAIRTLRFLDHKRALPLLETYQQTFCGSDRRGNLERFRLIVSEDPEPTGAVVNDTCEELRLAVTHLRTIP